MYNIIYFEKNLNEMVSKGLKTYLKAIDDNIINNPTIFCDKYNIKYNIPIFHTFYIKNIFYKQLILVNNFDVKDLLDMGINSNIITVYDSVVETPKHLPMSYDYSSNNFNTFIKEVCK